MDINNIKIYLELLFYLSGVGLFILGIIGLSQLQIAKNDIKIRCQRDAINASLLQLKHFDDEIIPLYDTIYKKFRKNNFDFFKEEIENYDFNKITLSSKKWLFDFIEINEKEKIEDILVSFLNKLSTFSLYFTYKFANEEIAFDNIGENFCNFGNNLYPLICLCRKNKPQLFQNFINLFNIWNKKLKKNKLIKDSTNIHNELKKVLEDLKTNDNRPIGTE